MGSETGSLPGKPVDLAGLKFEPYLDILDQLDVVDVA